MINPESNPEMLNLEMLKFEEPDLYYEFDMLCFWATKDGRVYSASDSGCSCPSPFENYVGNTQKEVLQKLERVGSAEQAKQIFNAWNKHPYDEKRTKLPIESQYEATEWVKRHLPAA